MTQTDFQNAIDQFVKQFADSPFIAKVRTGKITREAYQQTLCSVFQQVYSSASTFSLAAAYCPAAHFSAKSYLMQHAEEEKEHWRWVLSDLKNTGYTGPSPQTSLPSANTAAYIAYNFWIASTKPIARLAIAATLESLGANYGARCAKRLQEVLGVAPEAVVFVHGHGDTDVGHTADIVRVLAEQNLSAEEWTEMTHVAGTAFTLWLSFALFTLCFGSFTWATVSFFRTPARPSLGYHAIRLGGLVGIVWQGWAMWQAETPPPALGLASAVYLLSLALFWSAWKAAREQQLDWAFSPHQPAPVLRHGPYRWIRHPFYSSYLLAWLAGAIATADWWQLLPAIFMGALYTHAAFGEESAFLNSPQADEYRTYQDTTGLFWPGRGQQKRLPGKNTRVRPFANTTSPTHLKSSGAVPRGLAKE